jgi:hypothetical protein
MNKFKTRRGPRHPILAIGGTVNSPAHCLVLGVVKANAQAGASMRSHRLDERERPEILERRVPMRGGFAPVSLGVDDRAEGGEIAVFIDRRPEYALANLA